MKALSPYKFSPERKVYVRNYLLEKLRHLEPHNLRCSWQKLSGYQEKGNYFLFLSFDLKINDQLKEDLFTKNHHQFRDFTFSFSNILKSVNSLSANLYLVDKDHCRLKLYVQIKETDLLPWERNAKLQKLIN